jgi:glutaredoxin
MKYSLKIIVLENCPYSMAAVELLNNYNIKFKQITVNQETKHKYKTDIISTFPQIYIIEQDKELLIGGYLDIEEIINIINQNKNLTNIKKNLNKKYTKFDNKRILRIIEIFINKSIN